VALDASAYCQGDITASGRAPFVGEVAANIYPLGTRLVVSPAVWGRTRFVVEDRIGWGSSIDFYTPECPTAIEFGRRVERVQVVK
jgi:3D (Asp-Asp-Asp) domain-containing protein